MTNRSILYRRRKIAKNEFTALTGVRAFSVLSPHEPDQCLVVEKKTYKGRPIQFAAYSLYTPYLLDINRFIVVKSSCLVANCVRKEHLIAEYRPSKKELDAVDFNKNLGIEWLSNAYHVPVDLLSRFSQSS